jgi:dimethylargininase
MMFRNAIVRLPAASIVNGLESANLGRPDFTKASEQHSLYNDLLKRLGLVLEVLPEDELYPDSTFIEDVALCTKACAVITRPGAESRRGETEKMNQVLPKYYEKIEIISYPGTVEAGDIMMVGDHFYIGISERTNNDGADQMIRILANYGLTGSKVQLKKMLHLKSGVSYLENNTMLVCGEFADNEVFKKYNRIEIDTEESYAANSLWINGKIIMPQGYPKTREKIEMAGLETFTLDVSEFRKVDGGLSCLSLRF